MDVKDFQNELCKDEYRFLQENEQAFREIVRRLAIEEFETEVAALVTEISAKQSIKETLNELCEFSDNRDDYFPDISSLKKRIKYCKHPLELRKLEQELAVAYKKKKKISYANR